MISKIKWRGEGLLTEVMIVHTFFSTVFDLNLIDGADAHDGF